MSKLSIKFASRVFAIAASIVFAGNAMAQSDTEPPQLHSLKVENPVLFASSNEQQVDIEYVASDNLSGLDRMRLRAISIPNGQVQYLLRPAKSFGGVLQATGNVSLKIPAYARVGKYNILVDVKDKAGNVLQFPTNLPTFGAVLEIKEHGIPIPSGNETTVDTNGSCMFWQLNKNDISQNTMLSDCGGNFDPVKGTMRGSCQVILPNGPYKFRYGGHHGYILDVNNGQISYSGSTPPNASGLIFTQNNIQFNTAPVRLEADGFPGTFGVEGEVVDETCSDAPEKTNHIMRGANIMVTGEWVDSTNSHQHGTDFFVIGNDDLLKPSNNSGKTASPYFAKNSPKSISPNLYYWNNMKRGVSTNGAEPVLVVSGGNCPTGFKLWKKAKGRFLLGSGTDTSDGYGDEANAAIGETLGEAEHRLSVKEMPPHAHRTKIGQKIRSGNNKEFKLPTLPNKLDMGKSYERENTGSRGGDGEGDGLGKAYDSLPPYIAVNFCVPDPDANRNRPAFPRPPEQPCNYAGQVCGCPTPKEFGVCTSLVSNQLTPLPVTDLYCKCVVIPPDVLRRLPPKPPINPPVVPPVFPPDAGQ